VIHVGEAENMLSFNWKKQTYQEILSDRTCGHISFGEGSPGGVQ